MEKYFQKVRGRSLRSTVRELLCMLNCRGKLSKFPTYTGFLRDKTPVTATVLGATIKQTPHTITFAIKSSPTFLFRQGFAIFEDVQSKGSYYNPETQRPLTIRVKVWKHILTVLKIKNVKFTLEQALEAQNECRSIALLFI